MYPPQIFSLIKVPDFCVFQISPGADYARLFLVKNKKVPRTIPVRGTFVGGYAGGRSAYGDLGGAGAGTHNVDSGRKAYALA